MPETLEVIMHLIAASEVMIRAVAISSVEAHPFKEAQRLQEQMHLLEATHRPLGVTHLPQGAILHQQEAILHPLEAVAVAAE